MPAKKSPYVIMSKSLPAPSNKKKAKKRIKHAKLRITSSLSFQQEEILRLERKGSLPGPKDLVDGHLKPKVCGLRGVDGRGLGRMEVGFREV